MSINKKELSKIVGVYINSAAASIGQARGCMNYLGDKVLAKRLDQAARDLAEAGEYVDGKLEGAK